MTAAAPSMRTAEPLQLGELELSQGAGAIPGAPSQRAMSWLLTFHGCPVGRIETSRNAPGDEIRRQVCAWLVSDRSDPMLGWLATWATYPGAPTDLLALWSAGAPPDDSLASLTIAVCTRDRPDSLRATLDRIQAIVAPGIDVVVVDNAPSTEATRSLVARRFSTIRYVRENTPGLDNARNRALDESTADVVAFVDDDALVAPAWARAIRALFARNADVSIATGLVAPASLESEPARIFERYGGFGRGYDPRWLHAEGAPKASIAFRFANTGAWGTGTNLALRRRHVRQLGGFDPALDVGTPTNGGGDLEMMFRVLKAGGLMAYTPNAVVYHQHRETWRELVHQLDGWGTGMSAHLARVRRAHPEEAAGVFGLRLWLSLAWFARRYASSWVRPTFPRQLILKEWRASFRGARLYRAASRDLPTPRSVQALHPAARQRQPVPYTVTLDEARGSLGMPGAGRANLTVMRAGRPVGNVTVPVVDGTVGEDRWRFAVARACRPALLGADDATLRRRLVGLFEGSSR